MTDVNSTVSLGQVASQSAKELSAVLAIGGPLDSSDLAMIRKRLDEVVQATDAAINACESGDTANSRNCRVVVESTKGQDPIAEAAIAAANTHPPLIQEETQDLAAKKRTQAADFLPFDVQKASAGFPDGWDSSDGKYSSQREVSQFLKGKRITAVEFTSHNTIKFVLDDGLAVSLTPSGIDGDDLDLLVEKPAST